MKKYNDKYGEYMERQKNGESAGLETFLLGEIEGFGNLTASSLYINPADGQVSAGKRVPRDPSKPYDPETNPYTAKMSNNPSDYRTLNSLNFALSAQIDKYDAAGAVNGIVDSFANHAKHADDVDLTDESYSLNKIQLNHALAPNYLEHLCELSRDKSYVDSHCSVLNPYSFQSLFDDLVSLGLIKLLRM